MSLTSCASTSSTMSTPCSPRSHPVQIPFSASGSPRNASQSMTSTQLFAPFGRRDSTTTPTYSSAFQHRKQSTERPNAYISDADLWGIDDVALVQDGKSMPYLKAPPAPPRSAEQWLAQPLPHAVPKSWSAQRRAGGAARKASADSRRK